MNTTKLNLIRHSLTSSKQLDDSKRFVGDKVRIIHAVTERRV